MFKYPHGDLHGLNLDWLLEEWKNFRESFTQAFRAVITQIGVNDPPTVTVTYDDNTNNYEFDFGMPAPVKPSGFLIGYQVGVSGTAIPTGSWLANPPAVPEGQYLWTKTQVIYNNGQTSTTYAVSYQGVDSATLYFANIPVSAMTGDIATISDVNITADHVVAEIVFNDPLYIKTPVTWTTSAGSCVFNGTCTNATTVNVILTKKIN